MQNESNVNIVAFAPIIVFLCIFGYSKIKHYQSKNRLTNYRNRQDLKIDDQTIIIAIQPINTFASISTAKKDRYIELQIERKGMSKFIHSFKRLFGCGMTYYKVKEEEKKNNITFIQSLLQTNRVQFVIYTKLEQQVLNSLLKKLDLAKYFKNQHKKFYHTPNQKKHPTEIDSNIKRVMILTSTKNDHVDEDSQYFLVVKKAQLKNYSRALAGLIANNKNIDELHNEFVHWKIEVQSDYDSSHQKPQ